MKASDACKLQVFIPFLNGFFSLACVLRGFLSATYFKYAANKKPCAALPTKKIRIYKGK